MNLRLRDFVVKFILIGGWFNYTSHEYGHLIAARLLGFYAEIRSTSLNMTWIEWGGTPSTVQSLLFYMAGGLIAAMVSKEMARKNTHDASRILWSMSCIFNLIYGVIEGIAPKQFWNAGWMLGFFVAWMFLIWVLMEKKPDIWV